MSYTVKYPFTLTRSNQSVHGATESETIFEGFATPYNDEDTGFSTWEVEAWVTGFAQYQNGKVVSSVKGLRSKDWQVDNLEAFEAACVDRACFEFEIRTQNKAA